MAGLTKMFRVAQSDGSDAGRQVNIHGELSVHMDVATEHLECRIGQCAGFQQCGAVNLAGGHGGLSSCFASLDYVCHSDIHIAIQKMEEK